jgi:hypothetical protein
LASLQSKGEQFLVLLDDVEGGNTAPELSDNKPANYFPRKAANIFRAALMNVPVLALRNRAAEALQGDIFAAIYLPKR